jgi:hypothetical protein
MSRRTRRYERTRSSGRHFLMAQESLERHEVGGISFAEHRFRRADARQKRVEPRDEDVPPRQPDVGRRCNVGAKLAGMNEFFLMGMHKVCRGAHRVPRPAALPDGVFAARAGESTAIGGIVESS